MSRTTDPTLFRLWHNQYDRSLGIHQWFASTLVYGAVLKGILLLIVLYFIGSTSLYTLPERIAMAIPALFSSINYLLLVLTGFTRQYTEKQRYAMMLLGSVAVLLQIGILFSLITENLVMLNLQQEMIGEDAFIQFPWHGKASYLLNFVLTNSYAKWVGAFIGILMFLLHLFPATVLFMYYQSGRKAAFLEYLNLRKIAYEGK